MSQMTCACTNPNTCYYCYECLISLMALYSFTLPQFSPFLKIVIDNFIYMYTYIWILGDTALNHPFPYWWTVCSLQFFAISHTGVVAGLLYMPSYAHTWHFLRGDLGRAHETLLWKLISTCEGGVSPTSGCVIWQPQQEMSLALQGILAL